MLNDPLVRAFEAADLGSACFRHRDHLYVAWCYLRELPLEAALARFVAHIRKLADKLGVPEKYHATMTWAYLILLHEKMQEPGLAGASFDEIVRAYPSLLDHQNGILYERYDRAEIASEAARRHFVLPARS